MLEWSWLWIDVVNSGMSSTPHSWGYALSCGCIVAVCSLITYGCEAWTLSEKVMRQLNGANSQMLSRITGQTVRQEARSCTTSHDIHVLKHIRTMRMKYLGSILRGDPNSLTYCAVRLQYVMGTPGNLLMDAPPHENWTDLVVMTHDTTFWKEQTRLVP